MRVKVVKRFNDKYNHKRRDVGKEYEYTEARAKELEKEGFVKIISESIQKAAEEKEPAAKSKTDGKEKQSVSEK